MEPTKCYRVAGYAITDSVQLDYLKRYFTYMRDYYIKDYAKKEEIPDDHYAINHYTKKLKQVEKVMSEGLHHQPLIKQEEIHEPYTHYPDVVVELEDGMYYFPGKEPRLFKAKGFYKRIDEVPQNLPSFKLTSIDSIEIKDITDKSEKGYCDKKMYISTEAVSNEKNFTCTFALSLKEEKYICVEKVVSSGKELINDYLIYTQSYHQTFMKNFFNRKIDLALLGNGNLTKYKDLPVITMPKPIEEIRQ